MPQLLQETYRGRAVPNPRLAPFLGARPRLRAGAGWRAPPNILLEVILEHEPVVDEAMDNRQIMRDTDAIANRQTL